MPLLFNTSYSVLPIQRLALYISDDWETPEFSLFRDTRIFIDKYYDQNARNFFLPRNQLLKTSLIIMNDQIHDGSKATVLLLEASSAP